MNTIQLSATTRDLTGRAVRTLRQDDIVPGVMYGHDLENVNLSVAARDLEKAYDKAGESTLIDLQIGDKAPVKVLVQDIQKHPLTGRLTHVDFYQVNMNEKISTEVPIVCVGEAPAVKALAGVLVKPLTKIEVESLPADLPHELTVDISTLKTFEDKITLADIQLSQGVTVKADLAQIVALVEAPRSEAELKALEGEVKEDISGVEVLTEKKEEEGAAAEGAEAGDKKADKKEEKK